jgi:hypothetical protein
MALYAGATWNPLASDWASQGIIIGPKRVILHTMVGSLTGTDSYFRSDGYAGDESHFGVGYDGTTYQWQDTSRRADANVTANKDSISIETADTGTGFAAWVGSDVPAWTAAQLTRLADLVAWCCVTHNIPCTLLPDSLAGRTGVGYHRLGIDPWRVPDGEYWSSHTGKVCPGDRRVAQIPGILTAANAIITPPAPPTTTDPNPALCRTHVHS